jgi:hypothetical protein
MSESYFDFANRAREGIRKVESSNELINNLLSNSLEKSLKIQMVNIFKTFTQNLRSRASLADSTEIMEKFSVPEFVLNEIKFDSDMYQRYLLYTDQDYAVFVIAWKKSQETPFHNHPSNGCLFKVLNGMLTEIKIIGDKQIQTVCKPSDGTSYIDNNLGTHKIIASEDSLSLHVYSPPAEAMIRAYVDFR